MTFELLERWLKFALRDATRGKGHNGRENSTRYKGKSRRLPNHKSDKAEGPAVITRRIRSL